MHQQPPRPSHLVSLVSSRPCPRTPPRHANHRAVRSDAACAGDALCWGRGGRPRHQVGLICSTSKTRTTLSGLTSCLFDTPAQGARQPFAKSSEGGIWGSDWCAGSPARVLTHSSSSHRPDMVLEWEHQVVVGVGSWLYISRFRHIDKNQTCALSMRCGSCNVFGVLPPPA